MSQNDTPKGQPAQPLDPASLDQVVGGGLTSDTTDARRQEQDDKLRKEERNKVS